MLRPGSVCLFQASRNVFLMLLTYLKSHSYILSMGAGGLVWMCFESAVPLQFTLIWWRMVLSSYSSYFPQIQILKEFTCLWSFWNGYKSETYSPLVLEKRGLKMVVSCDLLPVYKADPRHRLLVCIIQAHRVCWFRNHSVLYSFSAGHF